MTKGKLIVIDGGDGSGKTVQSKLLLDYLKDKHIPNEYIDFPRYKNSFYGKLVGRFLAGEFGRLDQISPYLASLPYALDRLEARDEIASWLEKGNIVLANRYVTSSMAHQAAKVLPSESEKIITWIKEMEYTEHKMPKPDLVIYLFVPWEIGMELTRKQNIKNKLTGNEDIAERDIQHRIQTEEAYIKLARSEKNWEMITCVDENGNLLSVETIHKKVRQIIEKKLRV